MYVRPANQLSVDIARYKQLKLEAKMECQTTNLSPPQQKIRNSFVEILPMAF